MVERVNEPWRVGDKTFATRKEAEEYEGRQELVDWLITALMSCSGQPIDAEPVGRSLAGKIIDSESFVPVLRQAGVKLIDRKPKAAKVAPAAKRGGKAPAAVPEAAE